MCHHAKENRMNTTIIPPPIQTEHSTPFSGGICPTWVKVSRSCGGTDFVQATCSDPFCAICQKLKVSRAIERWTPIVEKWASPLFITLTMESMESLEAQTEAMMTAFRRLMHKSLGKRNFPTLRRAAMRFLGRHCRENNITGNHRRRRFNRLRKALNRIEAKAGVIFSLKSEVRFRDFIESGVRTWEVTTGKNGYWHFHFHILADMGFFPWELLVVLWKWATMGKGQIVDIRKAYSKFGDNPSKAVYEAFKYAVKTSTAINLTEAQRNEAKQVLRGRKRIWAIGDVEFPQDKDNLCSHCGKQKGEAGCVHDDIEFGYTKWSNYGNAEAISEAGEVVFWVKFHKSQAEDVLAQRDNRWASVYSIPLPIAFQANGPPGNSPSEDSLIPSQIPLF